MSDKLSKQFTYLSSECISNETNDRLMHLIRDINAYKMLYRAVSGALGYAGFGA